MFGQYKRSPAATSPACSPARAWTGAARAPAPRPPATARCSSPRRCCKLSQGELRGQEGRVSGSGNVAIYAMEKVNQLGGKVVACRTPTATSSTRTASTSSWMQELKEVERGRISEYADANPSARFVAGGMIWDVPCEVALPCATQNELNIGGARAPDQERLHAGRRGRQHALDARRHPRVPGGERRPVRPGQGRQRRRRGHLGAGDAAERLAATPGASSTPRSACTTSWSASTSAATETAEEYGAPGDYVTGRQHRRLHPRRRRDDGAGRHLMVQVPKSLHSRHRCPHVGETIQKDDTERICGPGPAGLINPRI
jgi:glutamate dehydrogenase (NADP+)